MADDRPVLVALALDGPHATAITRFVEATGGWQRADDGPLHAEVCLADIDGADTAGRSAEAPVVLLVGETDTPAAAARAAAAGSVAAVVAWPGERDRLEGLAAGLRGGRREVTTELRVGGAAGGVGTTTVALALAGLVAWQGPAVLVVSHGSVPAPTGRALAPDALAGPGVWRAAVPAPGLVGLRTLAATRPVGSGPVNAGPAELVVRDLGIAADADVLVVRRDGAGLAALAATAAGTVVCAKAGPVPPARMCRAGEGRRLILVDWSVRVARAGLAERVPAGLPGAWLARLAPVARALEGVVHSRPGRRAGGQTRPA